MNTGMIVGLLGILFLAAAFYALLLDGRWPKKSKFSVDWNIVRTLANGRGESLPLRINCVSVARGALPSWGTVAGDFSGACQIEFSSFQVVYPDKTVIIEAPFNRRLFEKFPYGTSFDQKNFDLMQEAMLRAEKIIPTHEHWDHLGGIAQSPHLERLLPKILLTKRQIEGPTIRDAEFPELALRKIRPLEYQCFHRAVPGVVLIEAPGHSRGHQMIYVILSNGREYLFTGDIVWVTANLRKKRARPRLANIKRRENRGQIGHQMRWLYDEIFSRPDSPIIMVATHDPEQHQRYIAEGLLGPGFSPGPG